MALRIRTWEGGTTPTYLEQYLRVNSLVVAQNAEEGSVATSTVTLDDSAGTLTVAGAPGLPAHVTIDILEDSAALGAQLLYTGATTIREFGRGENRTQGGREITVSLDDPNTRFHRRLMTESAANRPAETDVARITWALSADDGRGIYDQQYFNTASPVDLSAADYRGQFWAALFDDCAQQSGKNWFVFWNDTLSTAIATSSAANPTVITTSVAHKLGTGFSLQWVTIVGHSGSTPSVNGLHLATPTGTTTFTIPVGVASGGTGGTVYYASQSLWYDFSSSSAYPSTVKVSNVAADVNDSTVFASAAPTMRSDPSRIYSGVLVPYSGGSVYRTDATIASTIIDRDTVAPAINVKTAAIASARGDRYLAANRTDEQVVSLAVSVPAASVNKILPGHRLPVKATHLPGMSSYVDTRVLNRTVRQVGIDRYQLDLEAVVIEATPNACSPVQNAFTESYFNTDYDVVLGAAPTENNTLVAIFWHRGSTPSSTWVPTTITGGPWTQRAEGNGYDATQFGGPGAAGRLVVYTHLVGAGESSTINVTPDSNWTSCMVVEVPGTYVSVATSGNVTKTAGQELSLSRTSTGSAVMLVAWSMQRTTYAPQDSIATSTATELRDRWALDDPTHTAPHSWVAWTNTATAATMTITGSPNTNPNLNKWGIYAAALLFDCN